MPNEWRAAILDDVLSLHRGYDLPAQERRVGTVPVMGSFGVTGWHDVTKVRGPGVTVGRSGASFGVVSMTQLDYWPLNTCLYVDDFKGNDPAWVFHLLSQMNLQAFNSGSAQPSLNRNYIKHIPVEVPPLTEQHRIAGVLEAFHDLIETNRKLAGLQEQLAQTLATQAANAVSLSAIADFPKVKQKRPAGSVDHFSIPALDAGSLPTEDTGEAILSGKYVLAQPSVLISRLNPTTPRTWMAYPGAREAVCSPEFAVAIGGSNVATEEVWAVTSTNEFWGQMQASAGGTTNSRQRVEKTAVPAISIPDVRTLPVDTRDAIRTLVRGSFEVRAEAQELAGQRDELLPLLMSGRVRVSEVEGVA